MLLIQKIFVIDLKKNLMCALKYFFHFASIVLSTIIIVYKKSFSFRGYFNFTPKSPKFLRLSSNFKDFVFF